MGFYGFRDLPSAQIARQLVEERKLRPNAYTSVSMSEVPDSPPAGGASKLAKATAQIPARTDDDTPAKADVQPVKYDATADEFVNDGDPLEILSWVNAASANPADDDKGFIYVWIEQHTDGKWYWTGEDCPVIDPGEPITTMPGGGNISGGTNTIIVT